MKRWLQRIACRLFHPRETRSAWSQSTVGIPGGTMTDTVSSKPRTFCPMCKPEPEPYDGEADQSESAYTHWRGLLRQRLASGVMTRGQALACSPTWFLKKLHEREPDEFAGQYRS